MKSIIIIFCVLSLSGLYAQENATKEEFFFSKGSKAVLFSFSGLSDLNADEFNGGIGGKYYLNDNLAVRVGLQFDYSSTTTPSNADTNEIGKDGENSSTEFGISAAIEWHLTRDRVSPYLGGGIMYSTMSSERYNPLTWDKNYTGPVVRTTSENTGISSFEIFGMGGVEIFITKGVSLAAEYHLRYRNASSGEFKQTQSLVQGSDARYPITDTLEGPSESTIGFTTGGALTLAVYF